MGPPITNDKENFQENGTVEERVKLLELREYGEQQFDKLVIYLNSGALVITLGFIERIIGNGLPNFAWILFLSWSLFALSLLFNLYSHRITVKTIDLYLLENDKESDRYNKQVDNLNKASFWLFATGTKAFIIFAIINF